MLIGPVLTGPLLTGPAVLEASLVIVELAVARIGVAHRIASLRQVVWAQRALSSVLKLGLVRWGLGCFSLQLRPALSKDLRNFERGLLFRPLHLFIKI